MSDGMHSNAFNTAVRTWEWCQENPVAQVKLGLKAGMVDRWLTESEEEELLKSAEGSMGGQLKDIIILGLYTGMSQEEIINLKWQYVDLHRRTIVTTREKTGDTRTIPLVDRVYVMLKKRARVKRMSDYVFYNGVGKPLDRWRLKTRFNEAVKKSGISHFRFHDMRHTCATRLVQGGVDIFRVSKILGHKDVSTTTRYAHHSTESLKDAMQVINVGHKMVTDKRKSKRRTS